MPVIEFPSTKPFNEASIALFGPEEWKPKISDLLNVNLRSVQYWAAGTREVPGGIMVEIEHHLRHAEDAAYERLRAIKRAKRAVAKSIAINLAPQPSL